MGPNESFLKAYRSFESALRSVGEGSVLDYEEKLAKAEEKSGKKDGNLSKIRFCRQCRNFLSHEDQEFFTADKRMTNFLVDLSYKLNSGYSQVSKVTDKKFITPSMKLQEAMTIVVKHKRECNIVPVFDKNMHLVGILSYPVLVKYLAASTATVSTKVEQVMKPVKSNYPDISGTTLNAFVCDLSDDYTYLVYNDSSVLIGWY